MKVASEMLWQFAVTLWHVVPWLAGMGLVFAVLSRLVAPAMTAGPGGKNTAC